MSFVINYIENFLENTSGDAYCKDINGSYLEVNDLFLRIAGLKCFDDVIGKTDLDLIWHEDAPFMMQNDQEVIKHACAKLVIEPTRSLQGTIHYYLSHKVPLRSRTGKIIGMFGLSFLINTNDSFSNALYEVASLSKDAVMLNKLNERRIASLSFQYGLTNRQANCLHYLVRGMTMKQIANKLNISARTVEHYLEAVKIKLNCYTRHEVIEKALQMGFGK